MKMIKYILMIAVLLGLLGLTNPAKAGLATGVTAGVDWIYWGGDEELALPEAWGSVPWELFHEWYPHGYPPPY
jgi:hypothetical protein